MDKLITLCWDCRCLFKESYNVETYMTKMVPKPKCENCGGKYGLSLCRVKNKEDE